MASSWHDAKGARVRNTWHSRVGITSGVIVLLLIAPDDKRHPGTGYPSEWRLTKLFYGAIPRRSPLDGILIHPSHLQSSNPYIYTSERDPPPFSCLLLNCHPHSTSSIPTTPQHVTLAQHASSTLHSCFPSHSSSIPQGRINRFNTRQD